MDIKLSNFRIIAADGGTATGKSRLVEELAKLLRSKGVPVIHISSGHLYRAVTLVALQSAKTRHSDLADAIAEVHKMSFRKLVQMARDRDLALHSGVVWLDGAPVAEEDLKGPGVGQSTSYGAGFLEVRQMVNAIIRRQINEFDGYVLIDGRDIGHSVVPDAPLKLLLTVSPHIAAERSREHTIEEVIARDTADRAHKYGALRHPDSVGDDTLVMVTDEHTPETIRDHVYELMREVFPELPAL